MEVKLYKRLLFWLIITLSQISCDLQGHVGVSYSMDESRRRNVFISEYVTNPNPYIINDTLKIKVLNAWVEKQWAFGKIDNQTIIISDKYQMIIEVEPNTLQTYGSNWMIGIDGNRYIRSCGSDCLMSSFDQLPDNTEQWEVQDSWELDSISKKNIIGKFKISKKIK